MEEKNYLDYEGLKELVSKIKSQGIELDDKVTKESSNGVKSSGIYAAIEALSEVYLPRVTSLPSSPATNDQILVVSTFNSYLAGHIYRYTGSEWVDETSIPVYSGISLSTEAGYYEYLSKHTAQKICVIQNSTSLATSSVTLPSGQPILWVYSGGYWYSQFVAIGVSSSNTLTDMAQFLFNSSGSLSVSTRYSVPTATAASTTYSNSSSGLSASNVQDAIDIVAAATPTFSVSGNTLTITV